MPAKTLASAPVTKGPKSGAMDAKGKQEDIDKPWSTSADTVLAQYGVRVESGLSDAQVGALQSTWGPNQLRETPATSSFAILKNQFRSLVVFLLLAASVLSFFVGDTLEAAAIAMVIFLTVATGYFTELRAVRSMEALRRLGTMMARVRRNGTEQMVSATSLVPGDILLLEGGDRVSADARLLEASKLQADESTLTGESTPVSKDCNVLPAKTPLADRTNMLYRGTTATRGSGVAVVVATGMRTELGRIAALVEAAEDETTPLEKRLAVLAQRLVWVCLGIAAVTVTAGIASNRPTMLMLETGIALAVAAIPEGLPVVATIALARGMWRLATRHALVKSLSAVETLGATSVIVADKTGTLTKNQLSLVSVWAASHTYLITEKYSVDEPLRTALEIGVLCGNASLGEKGDTGDPLEVALLRGALGAGIEREALLARFPEVREEAFDAETKMMATVHARDDRFWVAVKGAPESVLDSCSTVWSAVNGPRPLGQRERDEILAQSAKMAETGLRVLGLAQKTVDDPTGEPYADLAFVALVGLADPPRLDVADAIAACKRAGIRIVMATGDQPATARTIAQAVGLAQADAQVILGSELEEFSSLSPKRREELLNAQIFARVTPEQKLELIGLHQEAGAIVAMTGDGVNDAPALRKAEIGVAMGLRGTDVARDAAEMVLKDDSFDSIVAAVRQGRAIFENIRRFVIYLLSCNVSEIVVVTTAVALNAPLPLLPLQILFLNLVTDVFPALALGFGRGDPEAMSQPPRSPSESIVPRSYWFVIIGHAVLMSTCVLGSMGLAMYLEASAKQATTVSFLTLALAQLWHVFNMRSARSRILHNDVVLSPWVWGAVILCVLLVLMAALWQPLAQVLNVVSIDFTLWGVVLGSSIVPLVVGQIALLWVDLVRRRRPARP